MAETTATTAEPPFLLRATTRSGAGAFGVNGDQPTELIAVYDTADLERRLAQITRSDLTELRIEWREGGRDRWVRMHVRNYASGALSMRWTCPVCNGRQQWDTERVEFVLATLYKYHRHEDQPAPATATAGPVCALTRGKPLGETERKAVADFQAFLADQRRAESGAAEA